jgi:hypothetical protein
MEVGFWEKEEIRSGVGRAWKGCEEFAAGVMCVWFGGGGGERVTGGRGRCRRRHGSCGPFPPSGISLIREASLLPTHPTFCSSPPFLFLASPQGHLGGTDCAEARAAAGEMDPNVEDGHVSARAHAPSRITRPRTLHVAPQPYSSVEDGHVSAAAQAPWHFTRPIALDTRVSFPCPDPTQSGTRPLHPPPRPGHPLGSVNAYEHPGTPRHTTHPARPPPTSRHLGAAASARMLRF